MADTAKTSAVAAPAAVAGNPSPSTEVVVVNDKKFSLTELGFTGNDWLTIKNTLFPDASDAARVEYLRLCHARKLDPMKKPFHIVPFSKREKGADGKWESKKTEIIIPGIGELRTTASRTGQYAGCDSAEFGPEKTEKFVQTFTDNGKQKTIEHSVTYPEWCQIVVYRLIDGQRVPFQGPKVWWKEAYGATQGGVPNEMWRDRPYGQLEKCAEAGALRRAFPEELGSEPTVDEMYGRDARPSHAVEVEDPAAARAAEIAAISEDFPALGYPTSAISATDLSSK